jgi:hypothetical protein
VDEAILLLSKHPNFFADLSDISSRPWQLYNALLTAVQQNVTDSLLLGSDFPFSTPEQTIYNLYSVNHFTKGTVMPTIPRHVLTNIIERDTLAVLGLSDKIKITSSKSRLLADDAEADEQKPAKPRLVVSHTISPSVIEDAIAKDESGLGRLRDRN